MGLKRIKPFNLDKVKKEYVFVKAKTPLKLANDIQQHFLRGFQRGGGSTDASIGGWAPRKTSRSARERKRSKGRALLVRSGKTRADIKKRKISQSRVVVGTRAIPYAGYLNDGTPRMEQREFIGDSRVLEAKLEKRITREIDKIFKV